MADHSPTKSEIAEENRQLREQLRAAQEEKSRGDRLEEMIEQLGERVDDLTVVTTGANRRGRTRQQEIEALRARGYQMPRTPGQMPNTSEMAENHQQSIEGDPDPDQAFIASPTPVRPEQQGPRSRAQVNWRHIKSPEMHRTTTPEGGPRQFSYEQEAFEDQQWNSRYQSMAPSGTSSRRYSDGLDWNSFKFKVGDNQELRSQDEWLLWNEQLTCTLQGIGWEADIEICAQGEGKLAAAIIANCKGTALIAIANVPGGMAKWLKLQQIFAQIGEQRNMTDIGALKSIEYKKGANATLFVAEFLGIIQRCGKGGMKFNESQERQFFFNAITKSARTWMKRKQDLIDFGLNIPLNQLYESFCQEFIHTEKAPATSHSAFSERGRGRGRGGDRGRERGKDRAGDRAGDHGRTRGDRGDRWRSQGDRGDRNNRGGSTHARRTEETSDGGKTHAALECFVCGKTGHIARNCPQRGGGNKEQKKEGESHAAFDDTCCHANGAMAVEQILGDLSVVRTQQREIVIPSTNLCFSSQSDSRSPHFLFDTGSDVHITNDLDDFIAEPTKITEPRKYSVTTGGGKVYPEAIGTGRIALTGADGNKMTMRLSNLLYIPTFPVKIFSGERLWKAGGGIRGDCIYTPDGRVLTKLNVPKRGFLLWTYGTEEPIKSGRAAHGISTAATDQLDIDHLRAVFASQQDGPEIERLLILWHRRLGHCSAERLRWTIKNSAGIDLNEKSVESLPCVACDQAKMVKIPSHDSFPPATYAGESIHFDLGEIKPESIDGSKYFELRTDLYSRYREVEAHKTKGNVLYSMTTAVKSINAQLQPTNRMVKVVHIDGARELTAESTQGISRFEDFCCERGIKLTVSAAHNHHQNGISERGIRVIQDSARAISIQMQVPSCFWDRLLIAAAYVTNRTATKSLNWLTPHQVKLDSLQQIEGQSPNVPDNSHLREIGSICTAYVEKEYRTTAENLEPRGLRAMLLGFAGSHNYILWAVDGGRFIKTPNVIFYESVAKMGMKWIFGKPPEVSLKDVIRSLPEAVQRRLRHRRSKPKSNVKSKDLNTIESDASEAEGATERPTIYQCEAPIDAEAEQEYEYSCYLTDNPGEPNNDPNLKEALQGSEATHWKESIAKEIKQLIETGTLQFVELSKARAGNLVTAKWVLKRKLLASGNLDKLKSRLVARGFTQREGIDFNETSSTTSRAVSWRILLALTVLKKWKIAQVDFKGAFLLGDLKEQIYMRQFPQLEEFFESNPELATKLGYSPSAIILLRKPLYGLKQSGAMWQKKVRSIMAKERMIPLTSDDAVYRREGAKELTIAAASHVDDFLVMGEDEEVNELLAGLTKEAEITQGAGEWFLGIELDWQEASVTLSQRQYVAATLRDLGMEKSRPVATPMEKPPESEPGDPGPGAESDYARTVGKLMYAAYITRPDLQYAVSKLSQRLANSTSQDENAAKRVLRYLSGTGDLRIKYERKETQQYNSLGLYGVADASFANVSSARSTTGVVFFMAGGPIAWSSRLQKVVAQSTTEAEYYASNEAAKEAAWIRAFLTELMAMPAGPIEILNDNQGALTWVQNTAINREKRHVRVRYHYVRQEVEDGLIRFSYVPTNDCAADGLTKALDRVQFERFVTLLGMENKAVLGAPENHK